MREIAGACLGSETVKSTLAFRAVSPFAGRQKKGALAIALSLRVSPSSQGQRDCDPGAQERLEEGSIACARKPFALRSWLVW